MPPYHVYIMTDDEPSLRWDGFKPIPRKGFKYLRKFGVIEGYVEIMVGLTSIGCQKHQKFAVIRKCRFKVSTVALKLPFCCFRIDFVFYSNDELQTRQLD